MIKLYEHPLSAYAMKAKIGLLEKGIAFEAVVPAGMMDGRKDSAFTEASPRGEIPALVDGTSRCSTPPSSSNTWRTSGPIPPCCRARPPSAPVRA